MGTGGAFLEDGESSPYWLIRPAMIFTTRKMRKSLSTGLWQQQERISAKLR